MQLASPIEINKKALYYFNLYDEVLMLEQKRTFHPYGNIIFCKFDYFLIFTH